MTDTVDALTLDINTLTLGQVEFLCDYAEIDIDVLQASFTEQQMPLKLIIATIALAHRPNDLKAGLKYARGLKLADIQDMTVLPDEAE